MESTWSRLIVEADRLHLPTKFLKRMPADFIRFEFDDLRTYAAEYHPGDHRMVLNRSLSFNAAGAVLKPLRAMTHQELQVLYHELFHAYMDYLTILEERGGEAGGTPELLRFARRQQMCRYGAVAIVPLAQRPHETEVRYLTESESWEALNETWAVFIGWAIWTQLEIHGKHHGRPERQKEQWAERLKAAFSHGEFRGYYVPHEAEERRVAQKRFLGKSSQLSWGETEVLMTQALDFSEELVKWLKGSQKVSMADEAPASC
ncbi:MAG: hypothetical protein NNA30_06610 [Nitrospira sp.]|nr:hypothetical protein [Nitrospira sp.]